MTDEVVIPIPAAFAQKAHVDAAAYERDYRRSLRDPEGFWREKAARLDWIKPFTAVKDVSFDAKDLHIRWFHDGTLNVSANCIDRHLKDKADRIAIIWEGDAPKVSKTITYRELHGQVCRFANVLKAQGVKK